MHASNGAYITWKWPGPSIFTPFCGSSSIISLLLTNVERVGRHMVEENACSFCSELWKTSSDLDAAKRPYECGD